MNNTNQMIRIGNYNSGSIRAFAKELGITHMELIGVGHTDGDNNNLSSLIFFFKIGEVQVADANGISTWEQEDMQTFAELAAKCGFEI